MDDALLVGVLAGAGMYGVWLAGSMKPQPSMMIRTTIVTFMIDDERVDERRLLHAADEEQREHEDDAERREVDDAVRDPVAVRRLWNGEWQQANGM